MMEKRPGFISVGSGAVCQAGTPRLVAAGQVRYIGGPNNADLTVLEVESTDILWIGCDVTVNEAVAEKFRATQEKGNVE